MFPSFPVRRHDDVMEEVEFRRRSPHCAGPPNSLRLPRSQGKVDESCSSRSLLPRSWPLPCDDAWQRKPAYFGQRTALAERILATD
jgi:hypothetical protein